MGKKSYDEMVGRLLNDSKFREKLLQDPRGAIEQENYDVSEEFIEKLENIDPKAVEVAIEDLEKKFDLKAAY